MHGRDAGKPELFQIDETSLSYVKEEGGDPCRYVFDQVFGMDAQQEQVYEAIGATAIEQMRQGFNSTVLAYGQTGSGKTFSMEGAKERQGDRFVYSSKGLIPRLFEGIFREFGSDEKIESYELSLQFVELYNEQLHDLFGGKKVVGVTMDPNGGYQCKDAVKHVCKGVDEAMKVYDAGCQNRAVASTSMNDQSSRSHALLIIQVAWSQQKTKTFATLNMVDLAGSEGMKKTGATGKALKEGIKINLSLTKLALVVKCLAEGSAHVPYRESKLTMMLQKSVGGNGMLHIILALSNSAEQVSESTACLRFGQSCLSMTIDAKANAVEKEQAEMKSVISEQMREISDLASENEEMRRTIAELKNKERTSGGQRAIQLNKDALREDLAEADEEVAELMKALEEKKKQMAELSAANAQAGSGSADLDAQLAGLDAQGRAERLEQYAREQMIEKMKNVALLEQEKRSFEQELARMVELQKKLQTKLVSAEQDKASEQERIRREEAERAADRLAEVQERAARLEQQLREKEAMQVAMTAEAKLKREELEVKLRAYEEKNEAEAELRSMLEETTAGTSARITQELEKIAREKAEAEKDIEETKAEQQRLEGLQVASPEEAELTRELEQTRTQLEQLEAERQAKGADEQMADFGSIFRPVPAMIDNAARRLQRAAVGSKVDPAGVGRAIQALPVLVACNDLRALTELEPGNRSLFQQMGGIRKMIDYMYPHGPQAPYATHIARTLPCVMDAAGRKLFHEYATLPDAQNVPRLKYLEALLDSTDPDDKEHACLAIAAVAQDFEPNRAAMFEHGISDKVMAVLKDTCSQKVPRQRLQRVATMALTDLLYGYTPFKDAVLEAGGVQLLLAQATPQHDPFVIKESLSCLGRLTQGHTPTQRELVKRDATAIYSELLFAQMHDSAITELAALALVNLATETPEAMETIERDARFSSIRFEMLASMARALYGSMLRSGQEIAVSSGSQAFPFWGAAAVGEWREGNAGGDRTHTSFVDNPQYVLKVPADANVCLVLHDLLEDQRQRDRSQSRPLFLRLCVTAATEEALASRRKLLTVNSSGNRSASTDEQGVVQLDRGVNGFIDVAKTREIVMRCKMKGGAPDDSWIVIPHLGCSHQHSRYVLAVFADKPISLQPELQPREKRIITSAWTPLCTAPRSISTARWRNCPQFQLISMAEAETQLQVLLSYGERDAAQNRRYLQTVDAAPPNADERPMLSLYVMKNNVPDRRYVGMLSPQADNYVCHSLVTNSWCVQASMRLEPGHVYALLVVMAEPLPSITPLRLTLYSEPDLEDGSIIAKPLSEDAEWCVQVVNGKTDASGQLSFDLAAAGDAYTRPEEVGTFQATLVLECDDGGAFCSISTTADGKPHKQTASYAQRQAVLSVPLEGGVSYAALARCITQKQEAVRDSNVRMLVYTAKPVELTPTTSCVRVDAEAAGDYASRETSRGIPYGIEEVPEDTLRAVDDSADKEDEAIDPAVLKEVVTELVQQRDNLYAFTRQSLKGEVPAVIEDLRTQSNEQQHKMDKLLLELAEAKAVAEAKTAAAAANAAAIAAQQGPSPLQTIAAEKELFAQKQRVKQLQRQVAELSKPRDAASEAATVHKQLVEERERADGLEQALEEARRARGGAGADQGSASPGKAELGGGRELEESRRRIKQLEAQLAASGGGKSSACAVQ